MLKPYPTCVCKTCGLMYRGLNSNATGRNATWHMGVCGVCGEEKEVTEPRDFGYPNFKGHEYWEQAGIF